MRQNFDYSKQWLFVNVSWKALDIDPIQRIAAKYSKDTETNWPVVGLRVTYITYDIFWWDLSLFWKEKKYMENRKKPRAEKIKMDTSFYCCQFFFKRTPNHFCLGVVSVLLLLKLYTIYLHIHRIFIRMMMELVYRKGKKEAVTRW